MTVYEKGAEVIRMLQTLLGKDGFKKGMDRYVQLYDESAVTCNDFIQAMADANGVDLTNFSLWWSQAGTPRVSVETNWNQDDCTFTIRASQSTLRHPGKLKSTACDSDSRRFDRSRRQRSALKLVGSDEEPVTTAKLVLETADDEWTFEGHHGKSGSVSGSRLFGSRDLRLRLYAARASVPGTARFRRF